MGEIVDWYDVLNVGILFFSGSLIYMFVVVGMYYVEVCNMVNNCVSECIVIMLMINLLLSFVLVDMICVVDLIIYEVEF